MKLLWFSHFVPFPPRGGNVQRSFHLLRSLATDFEISLVAFNLEGIPSQRLREYEGELRQFCPRVQFWDLAVPWKSSRWWLELGLGPVFRHPHNCRVFWSPSLAERWARNLYREQAALVHFDSLDLALFAPATTGFRKVLNHHNCESDLAWRRFQHTRNPLSKAVLCAQAKKLARLEASLCHTFEANTVVSQLDAQRLHSRNSQAHIHVVENGTDLEFPAPLPGQEEPGALIFAGSLNWYPNLSGLRFFVDRIWPRIRKQRADIRLYLAGRDPSSECRRLARQHAAIILVPNPQDMRPLLARAAVFICPLLEGGGTRLKILDALAMGKAVVSTTIGCEGLRVRPGVDIRVADTPESFAAEILLLLDHPHLRRALGASGRTLVETHYGWKTIAGQLKLAYQCALQGGTCSLQQPASHGGSQSQGAGNSVGTSGRES